MYYPSSSCWAKLCSLTESCGFLQWSYSIDLGCIYSLDWTTSTGLDYWTHMYLTPKNGLLHWLVFLEYCHVLFMVHLRSAYLLWGCSVLRLAIKINLATECTVCITLPCFEVRTLILSCVLSVNIQAVLTDRVGYAFSMLMMMLVQWA